MAKVNEDLLKYRLAARSQIVPATASEVLGEVGRRGQVVGDPEHGFDFAAERRLHESERHRDDGTCYEWRSNGRIQTWKTRPGQFRWPIKYGMYSTDAVTDRSISEFHWADGCPVDRVSADWYKARAEGYQPGKLPASSWGLSRRRKPFGPVIRIGRGRS